MQWSVTLPRSRRQEMCLAVKIWLKTVDAIYKYPAGDLTSWNWPRGQEDIWRHSLWLEVRLPGGFVLRSFPAESLQIKKRLCCGRLFPMAGGAAARPDPWLTPELYAHVGSANKPTFHRGCPPADASADPHPRRDASEDLIPVTIFTPSSVTAHRGWIKL